MRRILLASAAIPGAFPPVMFDVTVDGEPHQEMHVDGGTFAQAFLYPLLGDARAARGDARGRRCSRRAPGSSATAGSIPNGRRWTGARQHRRRAPSPP
jgi:hypothetical protein